MAGGAGGTLTQSVSPISLDFRSRILSIDHHARDVVAIGSNVLVGDLQVILHIVRHLRTQERSNHT